MMKSVHDDLEEEGAMCEAEVLEDSSVESDNGGDNPQDEESVEDASMKNCVGVKTL